MRAAKSDRNQPEIVSALREIGATVKVLSTVGQGFPDLCVGYAGVNALLEVKMPDGKLTPDQVVLHGEWRGKIRIVRSAKEAVETVMSWKEQ